MRRPTWTISALLFGSGFCALVYQLAWTREFRLIFGASTAASAAVLAVFVGGLGIGGLLLGPRADRHKRPLLFYAQLETIVAVSAALSPFLLALVRMLYLASGGSEALGTTVASVGRMVLSTLVLAIPTLAMGGTLPAAARAATRALDVGRRDTAALYALNTLGAVAGCVVATFALLELFGTKQTIWLAAAVNLLIAMTARSIDRSLAPQESEVASVQPTAAAVEPAPVDSAVTAPAALLLAASAIVGFAFFLMELVWYRLLAPLLGGSVFTFGLVLAVALAGIGIGGLIYSLAGANRPATLAGLATTCLLEAAGVAITYALGDRIAILTLSLVPLGAAGFAAKIAGWTLVTTIVVLPPAIVAGYQFPLLIALFGRGRERLGHQIGMAYAANTAGAIVGSLAGGFGILPWLSAPDAWRLVAILLVLLGGAAAVGGIVYRDGRALVLHGATAAAAIACLFATGPTAVWRHAGIGAGRVQPETLSSPNRLRGWIEGRRRSVEWERDGVESGVALTFDAQGYSFVVNGKADGSARGDAPTQVMLGLLGALRHPAPKTALVIGLGTGSSAGWLGAVPSISRVDVVELEPVVLEVAQAARSVNHDVLSNPKVHVTIGDARETLLTTSMQYDVIASEPSNPYRAGIASLFTQEYYEAARDRLTEDGVFAQWVQGYEIDSRTLRTIYATLASVFPNIETWQTQGSDLVLIATKRPRGDTRAALAARLAEEPYRSALAYAWRGESVDDFLAHFLAGDPVARALLQAPGVEINTDDRNLVEFGLARSVGRGGLLMVPAIVGLSRALEPNASPVAEPIRSMPAVETARLAFNASQTLSTDVESQTPPLERSRQAAISRYFNQNDVVGARQLWQQQTDPPRNLIELAMAADIEAEAASDAALPLIERLRQWQPAEADTILATLRARQGAMAEATAALVSAFERMRTDPWALNWYKDRALRLVEVVAASGPPQAARLYEALGQPFALRAQEDLRLDLSSVLAREVDFPRLCGGPVGLLDAHPLWAANFLRLRMECYRATGDPRAVRAARDLDEYLSTETALGAGIVRQ
jgi:spermidine synthase